MSDPNGPSAPGMGSSNQPSGVDGQSSTNGPKIQQPTPQALPNRHGPASILVSPRQKGNPLLTAIRSVPWEYSDIPADYILGTTTCALFLSLKYHRLHPEYIYARIRALAGKYALRILLVLVDIENHEAPLKELSKTSLINGVTVVLAWSAGEAGRYLELFKLYEHASPAGIRGAAGQQKAFGERVMDFITAPRSINKTDALGLVSNFGSVRTAVNARPEEVGMVAGWGQKKVQRWHGAVREPFRTKQARGRGGERGRGKARARGDEEVQGVPEETGLGLEYDEPAAAQEMITEDTAVIMDDNDTLGWQPGAAEEEPSIQPGTKVTEEASSSSSKPPTKRPLSKDDDLSEGVMAALAKLRNN